MKRQNIDELIKEILDCVERHKSAPGQYRRWLWDNGTNRNIGLNEYGCADAANILYTLGYFPKESGEREEWVRTLQAFQSPETGMFSEPTHHTIHTTAHCTAALELFDASPLYSCKALKQYTTRDGLYQLLQEEVDWQNPWPQSHKGAGILPSLVNSGMVGLEWKEFYFDWMWEHSDPETGFFYYAKNGEAKKARLFEYMAGGFHYLFNHEAEHRPMRYPDKIVDSCLELMSHGAGVPEYGNLITRCTFIDIDVIYCLSRAMRQTPHRFAEGKAALEKYAEQYLSLLNSMDYEHNEGFNDLHMLFGSVCALAELQAALPGKLISSRPLKLVLDRRPFI